MRAESKLMIYSCLVQICVIRGGLLHGPSVPSSRRMASLVSPVIIGDSLVGSPPSTEFKNAFTVTYFWVVLQFVVYDYESDT
jgi:hypothetical protein